VASAKRASRFGRGGLLFSFYISLISFFTPFFLFLVFFLSFSCLFLVFFLSFSCLFNYFNYFLVFFFNKKKDADWLARNTQEEAMGLELEVVGDPGRDYAITQHDFQCLSWAALYGKCCVHVRVRVRVYSLKRAVQARTKKK
jgi:hypothetical protein